ncbi:hypothetical protein BCR43DRAFT_498954 [Syncephalastrum racemosum]|uniref:Uncharacterized protein n=1 Tax=Syncephalastrum racemosum TaxID=13706 RepID=A0A1X2H1Q8_SYNRA|nr:hypothetical protein BCR43DRAFT_498954 [Syncephalastrum racemosum]
MFACVCKQDRTCEHQPSHPFFSTTSCHKREVKRQWCATTTHNLFFLCTLAGKVFLGACLAGTMVGFVCTRRTDAPRSVLSRTPAQ